MIPGQVGVVPTQPGQLFAVAAETGGGEEIVTVGEGGELPVRGDGDQGVDGFPAFGNGMILTDGDQPVAGRVRQQIGEAPCSIH